MTREIAELERIAYLDALGVDVWRLRSAADPADAGEQLIDTEEVAVSTLAEWVPLQATVAACTLCSLHKTRTQTVFGTGSTQADLLVIGEAPGAEEDRRGEPFVGPAGQLLNEMLRAIGLDRNVVYIANILKCRPPANRDPAAAEAASCRPYLDAQIRLLQPKVVLALGRIAAQQLLGNDMPLGRMRGQVHTLATHSLPVVVTYHPAYLLRTPDQKRKAWQDLCVARDLLRNAGE